ncbi:MAG TPA: translation initiation factor IF-2 [Acidimicrobiales bacterium]|nr:translation initiation factor IF-2 [Acidimicrobiales bacterium]
MPKNIRVYELARELGLTNKEALDLCIALGIGVKSHSSSIVEAHADRVRRKAEREGLIRDTQPDEPEAEKKPAKKGAKKARVAAADEVQVAAPVIELTVPEAPIVLDPTPAEVSPHEPAAAAVAETTPIDVSEPRPEVAAEPEVRAAPTRVIRSGGATAPRVAPPAPPAAPPTRSTAPGGLRPAEAPRPTEQQRPPAAAPRPRPDSRPRPGEGRSDVAASARATSPLSPSGRPIPPPPRSPHTGRPIPPPPGGGQGGPRRATPPSRPSVTGGPRPGGGPGGRPGGPGGPRPGGGTGGPRPPRFDGPSPAGRGGPGAGSGAPGRGTGAPSRGPGRQHQQPRRKGRRRRVREELEPLNLPTYSPTNAPIPEGVVIIERLSTAQDVGPKLNRTAADVVRYLLQQGEMVTATQSLTDDMLELFAAEIGAQIQLVEPGQEQEVELQRMLAMPPEPSDDEYEVWPMRPPIVTVMGHVDHGKTKLLDRIRNTNVVDGEAGGITQHIGAYQVEHNGHKITFIDTPGHEAFTAMRSRGAQATDIVILVVAADDGVMPQTVEAINHAKAAEVPIMIAINKIDRGEANPDRVLQQVSEHGLIPESWGGDTVVVEVSALQGIGIDELLDNLAVMSEVEDLRAEPGGRAMGVVLEANLDIGRGPVATILVQRGTLRVGDPLVAGAAWGRVRALLDDLGKPITEAGPSTPVQVLGLDETPQAGDRFAVAPTEKIASRVATTREHWRRLSTLTRDQHALAGGARLEDLFEQIKAGEAATLNLIVKADVGGSLEALTEAIKRLERDEVKISIISRGVGGITKSDIQLASASKATIIGFNVRPDRTARDLAEVEHVEIRTYEIIYQVLEDIQNAVVGLLAPEFEEVVTGEAEVREVFAVPRAGKVAGCMVLHGTITRGSKVRFLRDGTIIWKGEIASLRRFKDDVREVATGFECGIGLSDFQDLKPGDTIETFENRLIPRT